jgi:hypothetical protein
MYLLREIDWLSLLVYLLSTLAWGTGGFLLVKHLFGLRPVERLLSGLATGFLIYIGLGNLFALLVDVPPAFVFASALVLVGGMLSARKSAQPAWLEKTDLAHWPQLVVFLGLVLFLWILQRGVALFDDYVHLPLVSVLAAGDFPPRFYLDPSGYFVYHYGLQVFSAGLVRMAGFFPWSAWDLSKAIALAFTFCLGWVWFRRVARSHSGAFWGTILLVFAGGARWLMLFLPGRVINGIGGQLDFTTTATGGDRHLVDILTGPWNIEGGLPVPFSFAFHSGIFVPASFVLGSTGAMPFMTVFLLLILAPVGRFSLPKAAVLGLILATLALSTEHLFGTLALGLAVILLVVLTRHLFGRAASLGAVNDAYQQPNTLEKAWTAFKGEPRLAVWVVALALGMLISLIQGGFITEVLRGLIFDVTSKNAFGFSLRWPPGLLSAHLGELSLFNPAQLFVLLLELGPALLLAPTAAWLTVRMVRRRRWLRAGLGLAAFVSMAFPVFVRYGMDRSITRMPAMALWLWLLLAFPLLWLAYKKAGSLRRSVLLAGYGITILGGFVMFTTQMTALPLNQPSYFLGDLDADMSRDLWGRLDPNAYVFDTVPYRSVTVFGQATYAHDTIYIPHQEWLDLLSSPNASDIARAGYRYVYIDESWWNELSAEQQAGLLQPCVNTILEKSVPKGLFRVLLDVSGCLRE